MLYDGYLKTKGKVSTMPFKRIPAIELLTLEKAKELDSYAGRLAPEAIMFDIDDKEQSEVLMNIVEAHSIDCRVIETSRGKHFTMINNGIQKCQTGAMLAIGLKADIKVGLQASYEVLKIDGKERFVEWDDGKYQAFPKWMTPINIEVDFMSMGAGDGRNSALFSYILTLQSHGFTKEEVKETIEIINNYVLKDKLSEDELNTILRDEAFPAPESMFYINNKFMHNNFAKYLMSEYHVKRINGNLYYYNEYYRPLTKRTAFKLMQKHLPDIKQNWKAEVLNYIDSELDDNIDPSNSNYIGFKNGVYDLKNQRLLPNSPEFIVPNTIPWNYNPESKSEIIDKSLDDWSIDDREIRSLLEECVGYCFLRDSRLQTAFILTGEKKNGKSTFLDTLTSLLGEDNVVSMDLKELDSNFKTSAIFGKLANIGDDISGKNIEDSSIFKKIVSGERITTDVKFQDLLTFRPYAKLIFSTNEAPRIHDKSGAVSRRLIFIPFDARFEEADSRLRDKLKMENSMEYLIQIGIKALQRLIMTEKFTKAERAEKVKDDYECDNDNVLGFVAEVGIDTILGMNVNTIYQNYRYYCNENNSEPETKIKFGKRLCKAFGLEKKQVTTSGTKQYRYFETKKA